jgi:hypothetical protein
MIAIVCFVFIFFSFEKQNYHGTGPGSIALKQEILLIKVNGFYCTIGNGNPTNLLRCLHYDSESLGSTPEVAYVLIVEA